MEKKEPNGEFKAEEGQVERPALLDIVKIDGRWAQVGGAGRVVRYLDTNEEARIDWSGYTLEKRVDRAIRNLDSVGLSMTEDEKSRIHWGSEQKEHPQLREEVTVFGTYHSKQK